MAESTELIVVQSLNPVEVFTSDGVSEVLKTIEEKALAHVPNLETAGGRKDIASLAFKVSRSKTLLDEMGKSLVEDAKKRVKVIDGHRKEIRDTLDALKEKVRQPLTDWEAEEAKRKAEDERKAQETAQNRVNAMAKVGMAMPFLTAKEMAEDDFQAMLSEATELYATEQARLAEEKRKAEAKAAAEKKAQEEAAAKLAAERVELERMRAEEDRKRKEAEEKRLIEEAHLRSEREKIEAERRKVEDARLEQEHREAVAKAEKEAAERAVREAKENAEREAREKAEFERREREDAAKREALRPDKEKLILYAGSIFGSGPDVTFSSDEAKSIFEESVKRLIVVNRYIIEAAQNL